MPEVTKKYTIQSKQSDGTMTTMHPETDADIVKYNNATSGLTATNTQAAIDELVVKIDDRNYYVLITGVDISSAYESEVIFTITEGQSTLISDDNCIGIIFQSTHDGANLFMYLPKLSGSGEALLFSNVLVQDGSYQSVVAAIIGNGGGLQIQQNKIYTEYATSTTRGLVQPVTKSASMTTQVGIDSAGALWTTSTTITYATDEEINALFS